LALLIPLLNHWASVSRQGQFTTWLKQNDFVAGQLIFGDGRFLAFDFAAKKFALRREDGQMWILDFAKLERLHLARVGRFGTKTEIALVIDDANNPAFSLRAELPEAEAALLLMRWEKYGGAAG